MRASVLLLPLSAALLRRAAALCHNECSEHGECNPDMTCTCHDTWTGADCSLRECPSGPAWFGFHTGTDAERETVECSNMGYCERDKGKCDCEDGYTGAACERTECPSDCHGRGRCVSMKELATMSNYGAYSYEGVWDAERIFGCMCDPMYAGYDCGQFACPTGDDPLTTGQEDEVQLVRCTAGGGSLRLSWEERDTPALAYDASAADVVLAFKAGVGISVDVAFSSGLSLCTADGSNVASVTFLQNFGDLSSIVGYGSGLDAGSLLEVAEGGQLLGGETSVDGTKEDALCANHGMCVTATGRCACYQDFQSSDGRGGPGARGDCGYERHRPTACPAYEEVECAGHGTCGGSPDYQCECYDGWDVVADCSERTCPKGLAWFGAPSADETAHDEFVECSNRGVCDRVAGTCECADGFTGAACDVTICHGLHTSGVRCQQGGACFSQAQVAMHATDNGELAGYTYGVSYSPDTWDAHKFFGCACEPGHTGYDCGQRTCLTGHDPNADGDDELQAMQCTATSGSFTLEFRTGITDPIAFDATAAEVDAALESLAQIELIDVTFSSATDQVCASDGSNYVSLHFAVPDGDVPAIIPETVDGDVSITFATDGDSLGGIVTNAGTTLDVDCSRHGICNEDSGVCDCFVGYGYSDGRGGAGVREDCGYRLPQMGQVGGAATALDCNDRRNRDEPECVERLAKAFAARLERG